MPRLIWDEDGKRFYETGVDQGVLYRRDNTGAYTQGIAWNGLTSVSESPSGAESNKQYADNRVYLNLVSKEEFSGTIEAYTYPVEFEECDGTRRPAAGLLIGQQARRTFGFAYRTRIGNDISGTDLGYKIHVVYGALASPSEKAYSTINDSPEAITFSWEFDTTPVDVPNFEPTSVVIIDSRDLSSANLKNIEDTLYGTSGSDARLPLPAELISMSAAVSVTPVTATAPSYNATTKVITIPTVTGVTYYIDGKPVTGSVTITKNTVVEARANSGYRFADGTDNDWGFTF